VISDTNTCEKHTTSNLRCSFAPIDVMGNSLFAPVLQINDTTNMYFHYVMYLKLVFFNFSATSKIKVFCVFKAFIP